MAEKEPESCDPDDIKEWNLKFVSFDKNNVNKLNYKNDKKEKCIETCNLLDVQTLSQLKQKKNFLSKHRTENIICLSYGKTAFYLKTDNKKDLEEWYAKLEQIFVTSHDFVEDKEKKCLTRNKRHSDLGKPSPRVVSTISTTSHTSAPGMMEHQFCGEEEDQTSNKHQEDSSSTSSCSSGNITSGSSRRESSTSSSSSGSDGRRNSGIIFPIYENVHDRSPVEDSDGVCSEDSGPPTTSNLFNPGRYVATSPVVSSHQERIPIEQDEKECGVPIQESGSDIQQTCINRPLEHYELRQLSKSLADLSGEYEIPFTPRPMPRPTTPKPKKKTKMPLVRQNTCPPGMVVPPEPRKKKTIGQLKKEIPGRENVQVSLPLAHLESKSIALCPLEGYVWITGWTISASYLVDYFCVGDLLVSINGIPCKEKDLADRIIKSSCENKVPGKALDFIISRVPGAILRTIKKREGENDFGLILKERHEGVEIVGIVQGSSASQAGIPPKTTGMDSKHYNWVITEINLTPVDIFSNVDNVKRKLNKGGDVTLLLQSADKIGALKTVMKQIYKDLANYGPK